MNKQFELIQVEQNMEGIAVKKHNPLLKILKYALVGAVAFIALILLFAVGSSVINPAIDSAMQKMGISESIVATDASPVAYAWTSPRAKSKNSGGDSNANNSVTLSNNNDGGTTTSLFEPISSGNTMLGWNDSTTRHYAYSIVSGSGTVDSSGGFKSTDAKKVDNTYKAIYYVDLLVDDAMRAAITNGQLSSISITFSNKFYGTGSGGSAEGAVYFTYFILSTNAEEYKNSDASINNFPDQGVLDNASNIYSEQWTGVKWRNTEKTPSATVSLDLKGDEVKIRFGVSVYIYYESRSSYACTVCTDAPGFSNLNITDYKNGRMQINVITYDNTQGDVFAINGGTVIWGGRSASASEISEINNNADFPVDYGGNYDLKADPEPGYYFAGWQIGGGGRISEGQTSYNYNYLNVSKGAYVTTTPVIVTAYFYPMELIGVTDNPESPIYMNFLQDSSGNAVAQGPSYVVPSYDANTEVEDTFEIVGGAINNNYVPEDRYVNSILNTNTYYKLSVSEGESSYESMVRPSDAGEYIMVARVIIKGQTSNEQAVLGYYYQKFTIERVDLTDDNYSAVNKLEAYTFNNQPHTPVPTEVKVKSTDSNGNDVSYKLIKDKDYTIGAYANNQYVGTGNVIINATNKNFEGSVTVYFDINPLDISTLMPTVKTAQDIQAKYGNNSATTGDELVPITYNGYQARPDVIFVTLTDGTVEYELYRTVMYSEKKDIYGYTDAVINESALYKPFFRIVNIDIDTNGNTGSNRRTNQLLAYSNNINTCLLTSKVENNETIWDFDDNTTYASFQIMVDNKNNVACNNLTGTATIYFCIGKADLSKATVDEQPNDPNRIYTGEAWIESSKFAPDIAYLTLHDQYIWVYNSGTYTQAGGRAIRFAFKREGATVSYDESIKSNCGATSLINGRWEDFNAGTNGYTYFTDFCGTFAGLSYENNVNVTRDENGEVIAGAIIYFTLDGVNAVGSNITKFQINPLDLASNYVVGTDIKGQIGFFGDDTNALSELGSIEYTGEQLMPTPDVYAHVNNSSQGTKLLDADRYYSYPSEDGVPYDNINVRKGGIVYVTGKGNYTGTISITFAITPRVVTAENFVPAYLPDVEYTGQKPEYPIEIGTSLVFKIDENSGFTINGETEVTLYAGSENNISVGDFYSNGVESTNTEVSTAYETNEKLQNYIEITMIGNYKCGSPIRVYFGIAEKDISTDFISATTNWSKNDESYVKLYYTGNSFEATSLDGNKDTHIILTYSPTVGNTTYNYSLYENTDYTIVGGGTNIDAGTAIVTTTKNDNGTYTHTLNNDVGGYIILKGINNYSGELAVPFTILPRDIGGTGNQNVSISSAVEEGVYYESFTGSQITPSVIAVNYVGKLPTDTDTITINGLVLNTDYTVDYGDNINVLTGGTVIIKGIGNFAGEKVVPFEIRPIGQTVTFFDPKEANSADYLMVEESEYAMYYVNADDKAQGIKLVATTTAIYPGAMPITFVVTTLNVNGGTKARVRDISSEIKDGVSYTYATLYFDNAYGIVEVRATQIDENGNYIEAEDGENVFTFYGKKSDKASGLLDAYDNPIIYEKMYGDGLETIYPDFDSNGKATISVVSDNGSVVVSNITSAGGTEHSFDLSYLNAIDGVATITVSHDGYTGARKNVYDAIVDDDDAYIPFKCTFTVTVAKRPLLIGIKDVEVPYGTTPVFEYTFTSTAGDGLVNGDEAEDVIEGLETSYSANDHSSVGVYDETEIYVRNGNVNVLSNNYDISYGGGTLTVTKRGLTVVVKMSSNATINQIIRQYGAENIDPALLTFEYYYEIKKEDGTIGSVTPDLSADSIFAANRVSLNYTDKSTGNPITKETPAGNYKIKTEGGLATNYFFNETEVTLQIKKASLNIEATALSVVYQGSPYEFLADRVTVKGIRTNDDDSNPLYEEVEDYTITIKPLERDNYGNYNEAAVWPENAGSYRVRITVTPNENATGAISNYTATTVDKANAIIISKIAPNISYELATRFQYTAQPISTSQLTPDIDGIGSQPKINYISEFWFAPSEERSDNAGCESNNTYNIYFSATPPTEIGKYDLICVYRADINDNYTDLIVRFNDKVEITTGVPTITINQTTKVFTYNAQGCALDIETDFGDFIYKPYGGSAVVLDKSNTTIKYLIDDEWVYDAPKNVGSYNVMVNYEPAASDLANNVGADIKIFSNAITIVPLDISIGNEYIKLNYTTVRRRPYNAQGQPLNKDSDVLISGVAGGTTPLGSVSLRYFKNGIEVNEPKNAGLYDIHVTYHAVTNDNYTASSTKVFQGMLEISRVGVTITMTNTYTSVYNGAGKGADGAACHGVMLPDGTYEQPLGTLSYQYKKNGSGTNYSEALPTAVGSYDVRINYVPTLDDNYYNLIAQEFSKVITITKATPSIVINKMTVPYGDTIVVDYTIRGAQYDLNGPATELGNGIGRVTINYGTRFTTADGGAGYDWSTTAPIESGKYSIRVDFTAGSSSNYVSVTQTAFDCLTISNILPTFELADKVVVYDGSRHNAGNALVYDNNGKLYTKWDGVAVGKYYYRGTLGYEYNKVGTDKWTTLAPNEVGIYNVRVHYYENPTSDVFSATTLDFEGALEIKALEIKVMPIYGQGHIYDGTSTEGKAIAYVYSYMRDGYKYMVYSRVGDLDRNQVIDLSSAEYVDENGHVYTIVTDASMLNDAWRDYYEKMITLVSGSFMDGDELITLEFSGLGVTEGKGEFTAENGKNYVVDLDLDVVYISNDTTYNLKPATGYFFSIVDSEGKVNVIEINTSNIIYANGDTTIGTYIVTIAGRQTIYTINLSAKTASANGEIYDIYNNIHLISYQKGSSTVDIKVDFSSFYYVSEDGKAVYKSANGETFLIDINTQEVQKVAELNIDTIEFSYTGSNNTQQTVVVDTNALEAIYSNNAYIGKYVTEERDFIINLKAKTVRVPTFYKMTINGQYYQFKNAIGRPISVPNTNMVATINKGVYTYASGTTIYYLDTNNMIAKEGANLFTFDVTESKLSQEVDGVNTAFDVDVREFSYKVERNGKFVGTTTLYGNTYQVENATLIAGNSWGGTFSILAQGAGDYAIAQGTLSISGNYLLEYVKGVNFSIERAKLTVSFDGIEDAIYDGENKFIDYTISGILNDETVGVEQSYDGDNLNVTDGGYRTKITITSTNYYLEGGVSDWYYILPALMEPIVVEESKPIIYDGAKHYLELKNVERGASVSYAGSETAPYFVEPGTYSVIAIVSKPNHVSLEVELKLTITKAKYIVTALEVPGTLKYGDALPSLICDSNLGTIALDPTQVLLPSVTTYTWTFTPYSQEFYKFYEGNSADGNTITGTIELKVQKAQANIEVTGELIQSETNPSAIIGIANGLSTNESDLVTIEYVAGDGTRYAKMPTAPGKYTVRITYAGDENYAETVYTTVLTIEQESNFDWAIYVGSAILVLALLSTIFFLVRRQKKLD